VKHNWRSNVVSRTETKPLRSPSPRNIDENSLRSPFQTSYDMDSENKPRQNYILKVNMVGDNVLPQKSPGSELKSPLNISNYKVDLTVKLPTIDLVNKSVSDSPFKRQNVVQNTNTEDINVKDTTSDVIGNDNVEFPTNISRDSGEAEDTNEKSTQPFEEEEMRSEKFSPAIDDKIEDTNIQPMDEVNNGKTIVEYSEDIDKDLNMREGQKNDNNNEVNNGKTIVEHSEDIDKDLNMRDIDSIENEVYPEIDENMDRETIELLEKYEKARTILYENIVINMANLNLKFAKVTKRLEKHRDKLKPLDRLLKNLNNYVRNISEPIPLKTLTVDYGISFPST